jgi:hypothetical protein
VPLHLPHASDRRVELAGQVGVANLLDAVEQTSNRGLSPDDEDGGGAGHQREDRRGMIGRVAAGGGSRGPAKGVEFGTDVEEAGRQVCEAVGDFCELGDGRGMVGPATSRS